MAGIFPPHDFPERKSPGIFRRTTFRSIRPCGNLAACFYGPEIHADFHSLWFSGPENDADFASQPFFGAKKGRNFHSYRIPERKTVRISIPCHFPGRKMMQIFNPNPFPARKTACFAGRAVFRSQKAMVLG